MRHYAILKTIEHFRARLADETNPDQRAKLKELIQREEEKLLELAKKHEH